ncbi:MAG: cytochrome C oxidase subunit IV family protein [Lutibacter sp.]|uniref:cytochrome C oxidase subunit IV family protein n=1 Tax=Lutibacter sp. TaxID=1925666 RepID=UPI00185B2DC2|nr:cytochrome C oxidase subunit IV family protein [Lutibacter sp.]MBT8316512.1 cytochrome C oxidase subunit IV family protein [Lutibacter sp.]NNJ57372.1 cytochrome C oxidase subunit IV family protein [Lutibacter sp.]
MAHAQEHTSHTKLIWKVFGILSLITIVEVILGIIKPDSLHLTHILGTSILNIIFLLLTLLKAYYITWFFMHMADEKKNLRRAVVWTAFFLIAYLSTLLLLEGSYIHDVLGPLTKWNY